MQAIAVLNAGSSSIKFAVYEDAHDFPIIFRGQVEKLGAAPKLLIKDAEGRELLDRSWSPEELDHASATEAILENALRLLEGRKVRAVGHRVVHGGTKFAAPIIVDRKAIDELRTLCLLAPLHQPHNLAPIEAIATAAPQISQVACFDTAFHRNQPEIAQMFAIPREYTREGIRRYGFHGLSYEYVSEKLKSVAPELASGRVIVAHLGNGSSLCAMQDGRSIATTMGFTALDGLMMGTRCGALDPGVLIYLMDQHGMDARALEDFVYKRCGLLGVSGIAADMRSLRSSNEPAARAAIELFVYRIVREMGSMAAAVGGVDAIVFTGGIGQNDAQTRAAIARGCKWMGLEIANDLNLAAAQRIDAPDSKVAAFVIATDEEQMIARHTAAIVPR